MTVAPPTVVVAAGVVCWRESADGVEVVVVHRDAQNDVSLPKGKVDPGESLQEAAVRETHEEVGIRIALGAPLGTTEYSLPTGRDKIVYYWAAEATPEAVAQSDFAPNDEIAAMTWLPIDVIRERLTYDRDREVIDRFRERIDRGQLRTFALIALRHGKAVPAQSWPDPDSTRPLEQTGLQQASAAARAIGSYAPAKLLSSTAARCLSTIEPLAVLTGRAVKQSAHLSQDAHEDSTADLYRLVSKRVAKRRTAVFCSHGPVLPGILDEIADAAGSDRSRSLMRAASLGFGDFSVVHLSTENPGSGIVAIETHSPPPA